MNPMVVGALFFACMFLGTLVGGALQQQLPDHHLDTDSRDTMKLGVGLIATLTALVLGLITADAKSSFQTMDMATKTLAAEIITLDRYLARYGDETAPIRLMINTTLTKRVQAVWQQGHAPTAAADAMPHTLVFEQIENDILHLPQANEQQQRYREKALDAIDSVFKKRWLFMAQNSAMGLPVPFMLALGLWLTLIFSSFGLYAPRNRTVYAIMLACSFSVACSIFLILELSEPFDGIIQISSQPLMMALEVVGK